MRDSRYDRDGRDGVGVFTQRRTNRLTNSAARSGAAHHNGAMPPVTPPADADHNDTAPTDTSDTSTGQAADTEVREARRGAADIAQRLLPALPALRTGALLSVIGAVVLFFAWPSGVRTAPCGECPLP